MTITVTFNENVTVTGTPTLALNSGGSASYSGGSRRLDAQLHLQRRRRRERHRPRLHAPRLARAERRHDQGRRHQQRDADAADRRRRDSARRPEEHRRRHDQSDRFRDDARARTASPTTPRACPPTSPVARTTQAARPPSRPSHVAIQDGAGNYWSGATFNQVAIFYNATGGTVAAWTYSTATLAGQLIDGHTYTITARSTDAAGNTVTTTRTFVYDTTSPTVTGVDARRTPTARTPPATPIPFR